MSYGVAYKTCFESLDGTLYGIEISIEGFDGRPMEISLDGDAPCVIEWQECGKADVIHSSTCTLRVSNERDRQMLQLMNWRYAFCEVFRGKEPYWKGFLDDALYEEPYSFKTGYVTEVVFSDFGVLNRVRFDLKGMVTVHRVLYNCLNSMGYNGPVRDYRSLLDPLNDNRPVGIEWIWFNADRFRSDNERCGDAVMKREVLEEVLRPLGYRIMQKDGRFFLYEIEYVRDTPGLHIPVVWQGTDAVLRASEPFGKYEISFEPDAYDTLAETHIDLDDIVVPKRYCAIYKDEYLIENNSFDYGFYIYFASNAHIHRQCRLFKTLPWLSSNADVGYAWIAYCHDRDLHYSYYKVLNNIVLDIVNPNNSPNTPVAEPLFNIKTDHIPLCPNYSDHQLRINLDLLLSPKLNPFEGDEEWNFGRSTSTVSLKRWKKDMLRVYVPVKLELLDNRGNVMMHYKNTSLYGYYPTNPGEGRWVEGPANGFDRMLLAYYNDGLEQTALDGWSTNKQTIRYNNTHIPSFYKKKEDGEYVPLPPMAGIFRLTVSNCVWSPGRENQVMLNFANKGKINWHLLRNAKITLVKASEIDDDISTDTVYERDDLLISMTDTYSETLKLGSFDGNIAPSARGLFLRHPNAAQPYDTLVKGANRGTLAFLRMRSMENQLSVTQPVLSGTAKLEPGFKAFTDANTPGVFLVTALRQDLHQATEEVTMARITSESILHYDAEWSDPVCAIEPMPELKYETEWSDPVCAKETTPEPKYEATWSDPVCAKSKQ